MLYFKQNNFVNLKIETPEKIVITYMIPSTYNNDTIYS